MGAGIVECDVTFTTDGHLVCRHAENDLHTTTNILVTPLATTCIRPFTPATFDANGKLVTPASAECRTSELTLAGIQEPGGQDGRVQSGGAHSAGVPGRHRFLAHRPLHGRAHPATAPRW